MITANAWTGQLARDPLQAFHTSEALMTTRCRNSWAALSISVLISVSCGDSHVAMDSSSSGADDDQSAAPADESGSVGSDAAPSAVDAALDAGSRVDASVPRQPVRDAGTLPVTPSDDGGLNADARAPDASGPRDTPDSGAAPLATKKFVGNITTRGQVRSDFAKLWEQITPENEGKWGSVEASHNKMTWDGLDRAHEYAKQHGVIFKQHTLVWGSQQPSWLGAMSASQQRAEVEEWIRLFCERYPDVGLIDVVNEPPPHTKPVYMEALGGAGASGYDWIVQSFKWARQYCPNAVLILNDYNNIEYAKDASNFIDIVKRIKAAGAPIDAVGAQSHDVHKGTADAAKKYIDALYAATGLPIYITEYDIDEGDDAKQAAVLKSQFTMFWDHSAVRGITLWGYVQGATWQANSGLMSDSGKQRPALTWLMEFLKR